MASSSPQRQSSTRPSHRDRDDDARGGLATTSLFASLSRLYSSETYSDLKIICGGETFHAHRAVVCSQSPFFHRALSGGFHETTSGVVELSEDDPKILRRFLQFQYTGNYDDGATPSVNKPSAPALMALGEVSEQLGNAPCVALDFDESDVERTETNGSAVRRPAAQDTGLSLEAGAYRESGEVEGNDARWVSDFAAAEWDDYFTTSRDLMAHVRVYIMAHVYDVPSLRLLSRDRFYRAAELCFSTVGSFPDVVDEVYRRTPETDVALREIVCRLTAHGIPREPEFRARMGPVMRRHGNFAVGVLNYLIALGKEW